MGAFLQSAAFTLVSFALVISVVVFFHELGHLLVGKAVGVKALRFSIGFGPKIFGFRLGETEYRASLLPLGGYVKFAGDNPYEEVAAEDRGRGFLEQAPWKKAAIAFAGPGANFLLALVIAVFLGMAPREDLSSRIGSVAPQSPAAKAGLRAGDRITAIDGEPVQSWSEMQERIRAHVGQPLELSVQRGDKGLQVRVVPAIHQESNALETIRYGRLGILASARKAEVTVASPGSPAGAAGLQTFDLVTAVDGKPIADYEELSAALEGRATPVELGVLRRVAVPAPGAVLWREDPLTVRLPAAAAPGQYGLEPTDLTLFAVQPGSAAEEAGLRRGDRVVAVNGKPAFTWVDDVDAVLRDAGGAAVNLTVRREGGKEQELTVRQHLRKARDEAGVRVQVPELGAVPSFAMTEPARIHLGWSLAGAGKGVELAGTAMRQYVLGVSRIVTGRISTEAIGGPLMIADVARQAAEAGWRVLLFTIMGISIALGVMNLLPVPVLDGFHVLSALIEAVRRKPLSLRFREVANVVGIALLLSLMLFAFRNDAMRKWFE